MTPAQNRKRSLQKTSTAGISHPKYFHSSKWSKRRLALSRKLGRKYGRSAYAKQIGFLQQSHESNTSQVSTEPGNRNKESLDDDPSFNEFSTSSTRRLLFPPRPSTPWSSKSAPALLEHTPKSDPNSPSDRKRKKGYKSASQDIDDRIIEVLLKPLSKTELAKDKVGNNYLFEVVPASDTEKVVVKIGHTTMSEQRRLKRISNQCNHFSMEREADPEGGPISLYQKAEKLMQAELYDCTYYFYCACGVAHREYFDVDKTTAQKVIRRWRAFCELEPYDSKGKLRPFWVRRLQERNKLLRTNNGGRQGLGEQEERGLRWNQFTTPTQLEKLSFEITEGWALVCRLKWEDVAFIEALAIAIITYPSKLVFGWVLIILIGFLKKKLSKN
ncbi:hypothetical protein CHU98_g6567 [Xylaria longipes]|nr:hypothetical protein CHU98_g6567 [Xylaria longipes]